MGKHYYCPICGTTQFKNGLRCIKCSNVIKLSESNFDSEYYQQQSQEKYGDLTHWYEFLFPEIENNPWFDKNEYEKEVEQKEFTLFKSSHLNNSNKVNIPKCPTCGSSNIENISALSRVTHAYAFGLFSKTAKSQFKCKNCGYKW